MALLLPLVLHLWLVWHHLPQCSSNYYSLIHMALWIGQTFLRYAGEGHMPCVQTQIMCESLYLFFPKQQ